MSLAQVQSDLAAARTALLQADYAKALSYALAAQALLAGMANRKHGDESLEFDAQQRQVDQLIANIRRQQTAALATSTTARRRSNVVYQNPASTGAETCW